MDETRDGRRGELADSAEFRRGAAARRVADLVRADIHAGVYGGSLSHEWELIKRYGTTRNALRGALNILQEQGMVERIRGVGTLTRGAAVAFSMLRTPDLIHINEDDDTLLLKVSGTAVSVTALVRDELAAPIPVAERLEISAGDPVLYVESLFSVAGSPQRIRSTWVAADRVPKIREHPLDGFLPEILEDLTRGPNVMRQLVIEAIVADRASAEVLETLAGAPILLFEYVVSGPDGMPVEFGFTRHRGDRTIVDSRVAAD
ncbi:GntR family transcriptional regulator [Mycobacterium sp. NAZ190054]|uniref:GntR family transcriptional regulator n=1 Tax=Mycobacterium sp. NAZ190054 TaxID=1747766 RepID=UPI0007960FC7|nr:GntR family transcriptional regulator [Mycobacterium sp. NAZ190054]KWX68484.1 hypothetical protein ASJ79_17565 [Mycobacterium sp. NAZ190054]